MSIVQQRTGGDRRQQVDRAAERRVGERRMVSDLGPAPEFRLGSDRRVAEQRSEDRRQGERRVCLAGTVSC